MGNLYVANRGTGEILKSVDGVISVFLAGLSIPQEIAFDASGKLYVVNYGGGQGVVSVLQ